MLQTLEFGACYVYSPRGQSEPSRSSRRLRDRIKAGSPNAIPLAAQRVRQFFDDGWFADWFGPDVVLMPVPGSAVLVEGALWVPQRIADALVAVGLGSETLPNLRRAQAVPKSAFAAPGERPSPETHFGSFEAIGTLITPRAITLVDDVITKGSTLIAAASRVKEVFPHAEIRAFALLRTMGLVPDIDQVRAPCTGSVALIGGEAQRQP